MATFKHPGLPGQLASGYSEDAAAILAASGWVDVNAPEPDVDDGPVVPEGTVLPAAEPEVAVSRPAKTTRPKPSS